MKKLILVMCASVLLAMGCSTKYTMNQSTAAKLESGQQQVCIILDD